MAARHRPPEYLSPKSDLHSLQAIPMIPNHRVSSHQGIFSAVFAMIYASWLAILRSVPTWLPDIKKYISFQWIYSLSLWLLPCRERQGYVTYKTAKDEEQYWRSAALHRRRLASSDARFADLKTKDEAIPLVMYYTPRLLPLYRTPRTLDAEANEYHLPARIFCKWHRMVFPGRIHPNLQQAVSRIKLHSSRDRQEIYRISCMLSDKDVFQGRARRTQKYRKIWAQWLDTKGPDIAIIFE